MVRTKVAASCLGVLLDVSVAGGLVGGPRSRHLVLDSVIEVELAGDHGVAVVRSIRPHDRLGALYGIEFLNMTPRFRARVFALVERASSELKIDTSE